MSSIYEKLKHFEEVILKDAAAERDKIRQQIDAHAKDHISLRKKKIEEEAEQFLKKEIALAESEKNNVISRAVIDSRQLLVKTRDEIINTIYGDVEKMLEEFTNNEEKYLPYLADAINRACKTAGNGELIIYLKPSDIQRFAKRLEELYKDLQHNIKFEQITDNIIGGCKVINKDTNIIVDETIAAKLESSKDRILEICDLKI